MLFGFGCSLLYFYMFYLFCKMESVNTFWNEFGVRYNFIAVNYLIYTNEVIEHNGILSVIPLFSALFALAGFITYFIVQNQKILKTFLLIQKIKISGIYLYFWLHCFHLIYQRKKTQMYL
jgi:hypothetical protein